MSRLRSRYSYDYTQFPSEVNNNVHVTIPDLALSIEDIFKLALDGVDPSLEYVPDTSYFEDLSDILPNIDELHVVTPSSDNVADESHEDSVEDNPSADVDASIDNANPT